MTEPAKDFWARADRDLLDRWPKDEPSWTSSGS